MKASRRRILAAVVFAVFSAGLASCTGSLSGSAASGEPGSLLLLVDGDDWPLEIEAFDIYLVDPESEHIYAEQFHVYGPGLDLIGSFPMDLRVGYGEDLEKLLGRTINILPKGQINVDGVTSRVDLPGRKSVPVSSGILTVEEFLGNNPEGAGGFVQGRITLNLSDGTMLTGTFNALAKSWG